ncbi:hypothetical protein BKA70DRAFT_1394047 [Coprinopsis sp. MPI-PUGE-AT-0042]|nr:hypothetical protein BKA70DRAFT_1394047 [Coprinopsis sp. MPI-PUGE-AT-0042]
MSNAAPEQANQDADFWEFIVCSKCYLPYTSNATLTVPFWLTECGHIVCNNHLNADQSCASCAAMDIQVAPLQRQMDEPMASWFSSIPAALDGIAFSAKFQQEMMANQIRHYRSRHTQYRSYIEKLRRDVGELRKVNELLSNENETLRQQLGGGQHGHYEQPADYTNANGKRSMVNQEYYPTEQRSSSPRSLPTPIAAHRLTLPPGQHAPELSSTKQTQYTSDTAPQRPPSNRRPIQQYAYVPPDTPQFRVPPLSRAQAAPQQFRRAQATDNNSDPGPPPSRQNMPPPQFAFGRQQQQQQQGTRITQNGNGNAAAGPSNTSRGAQQRQTTNMGPPPTPRLGVGATTNGFSDASKRFMPPALAKPQEQRRFFPLPNSSDQNAGPSARNTASSIRPQQQQPQKASSGGIEMRTGHLNVSNAGTGAQRMPFLPGGNKPATGTSGLKVFKPR